MRAKECHTQKCGQFILSECIASAAKTFNEKSEKKNDSRSDYLMKRRELEINIHLLADAIKLWSFKCLRRWNFNKNVFNLFACTYIICGMHTESTMKLDKRGKKKTVGLNWFDRGCAKRIRERIFVHRQYTRHMYHISKS